MFHKNIFHNKIGYYISEKSCSIIDVHAYSERKQNNFYYNVKTDIHRKFYNVFSTTFHIQSDLNLI